jgi:hypothetical protein
MFETITFALAEAYLVLWNEIAMRRPFINTVQTRTNESRAFVAALAACLLSSGSIAHAGLPAGVSGLVCTAPNRARLRLNIDVQTRQFEKEGFSVLPFVAVDADRIILSRFANHEIVIVASLDLRTLIYSAQSREAGSGSVVRTDYQCVVGAPIAFSIQK